MRKDDVQMHSEYGDGLHAAVNVKIRWPYGERAEALVRQVIEGEFPDVASDPSDILDAIEADSAATGEGWDLFPIMVGWEQLTDRAREIWGPSARVWSEGRSSGWAVVEVHGHTLDADDVAGWDAIELGRWARFAAFARATADDIPYMTVDAYLSNNPARVDVAAYQNAGVGL